MMGGIWKSFPAHLVFILQTWNAWMYVCTLHVRYLCSLLHVRHTYVINRDNRQSEEVYNNKSIKRPSPLPTLNRPPPLHLAIPDPRPNKTHDTILITHSQGEVS
jgi:hypothetical protein